MLLERIYDDDLAQASYLVGCQATGGLLVVDPRRDVGIYLDAARRHNLRITAVAETHIHADYLSGARELVAATGARLYLSDEGGEEWQYRFEHERIVDGSEIRIGNITVTAVHTPGHTPEHLSFLLTDGAAANEPGYYLTGDFVFVGDVGRPDLLDEAAGGSDTRFEGARQLFASLRDRFLTLPDYLQVLPGHGAGSACGKALGAVAGTTVGYERRFAWWAPYVEHGDEEGFVKALLEGQPDAPAYFGRMKRQNRAGPALLGKRPPLKQLRPRDLRGRVNDELILIDTRSREQFLRDAVKGALHVPAGQNFATYASYAINPEDDPRPIVVVAADEQRAEELREKLAFVGIDNVEGFTTSLEGLERQPHTTVAPEDLAEVEEAFVLDVRTKGEFDVGHIPGATQIHVGRVLQNLDEIPRDRPVVVHCQGGARAAVAESVLRAAGFENVLDLEGSYGGWQRARRANEQPSNA
jgi:hydroxyacylglutathione hydrolase